MNNVSSKHTAEALEGLIDLLKQLEEGFIGQKQKKKNQFFFTILLLFAIIGGRFHTHRIQIGIKTLVTLLLMNNEILKRSSLVIWSF
jgi:hypothetical protein